jgi:hypothetical protein
MFPVYRDTDSFSAFRAQQPASIERMCLLKNLLFSCRCRQPVGCRLALRGEEDVEKMLRAAGGGRDTVTRTPMKKSPVDVKETRQVTEGPQQRGAQKETSNFHI